MTKETQELINRITEATEWNLEDCKALCKLAGLEKEWNEADGETFEKVIYTALDLLQKT